MPVIVEYYQYFQSKSGLIPVRLQGIIWLLTPFGAGSVWSFCPRRRLFSWKTGKLFLSSLKGFVHTHTHTNQQVSSVSPSREALSPSWQRVRGPPTLPEWFWSHRWSRWIQSQPHHSRYGCLPFQLSSVQKASTRPPLSSSGCSWPNSQPVRHPKCWAAGVKPQRTFLFTGLMLVEMCFRAEAGE